MKRRKARLTLSDWARIPTAEVKHTEGYETSREMLARLRKEEQEEREAAMREADRQESARREAAERPIRELEHEFSKGLRELRKVQAETLFTKPSDELLSRTTQFPKNVTGSADETTQAIVEAVETAFEGVTITPSGRHKIITVARLNPTVDIRRPETWRAIFDYITELGLFTAGDVQTQTQHQEPEPETKRHQHETQDQYDTNYDPTRNFDEVAKTTSGNTREGDRLLREAVRRDVVAGGQVTIAKFWEECRTLFNDRFTQDENDSLARVMESRNLNCNSVRDWHKARVLAVRAGYARLKFLTPDEQLAFEVETGKVKTDTFEQRRDFNRRVAAIHKGIPLLG